MTHVDMTIDRHIDKVLVEKNKLHKKQHSSSGKLSASKLAYPTLWQVLHCLGVPKKEIKPYVLRKFARGNDVEDWILQYIPGVISKQQFIEYKNVVGYADTIIDTSEYDFKNGTVPNEIKSVTNAAFKWIIKKKGPKEHHCLQAACYALGMGADKAMLTYVASDDYRIKCFVIDADDYKQEIDDIIEEYEQAMSDWEEKSVLPAFEPRCSWQENRKYSQYPAYDEMDKQMIAKEVIEILKKED